MSKYIAIVDSAMLYNTYKALDDLAKDMDRKIQALEYIRPGSDLAYDLSKQKEMVNLIIMALSNSKVTNDGEITHLVNKIMSTDDRTAAELFDTFPLKVKDVAPITNH